jgi:hypothetical protein
MKVTRTAAWSVEKPLKGAKVTFCLNEAIPESQEDRELLATIPTETTNNELELVGRDDPPFKDCVVTRLQRRDGTESIAMFSCQAIRIVTEYKVEGLARVQTGYYGCTVGQIDGRLCVGLISGDLKRALIITADRKTVAELILVLLNSVLCSDKIPHSITESEIRQAIQNHVPTQQKR